MGMQTIGSKYAANKNQRRAADHSHVDDEFELHTKHDMDSSSGNPGEIEGIKKVHGTVVTRVHALNQSHGENSSAEAVNAVGGGHVSDTNSEEIILQKHEPARGIVMTRDVTVRYSNQ